MLEINKFLLFSIIIQLIGQSYGCKCPPKINGKICGGFLIEAGGGSDCKFKSVYQCSGGGVATEEKSCGIMPCFTKQDTVSSMTYAYCFPSFPYLKKYEELKLKLLEEVLNQ